MPNGNRQNIVNELIGRGQEALQAERVHVPFTGNEEADAVLNNIEQHPHLFVLGCIADRRMRSEICWIKPYEVCQRINSFRLEDLRQIGLQNWEDWVQHAAGNMGQYLHKALERIENAYDGRAGRIWNGNPNCATVVRRFLEFDGIGPKITNMATNILLCDFNVPMQNLTTIDMPTDTNVLRVFKRLGLVQPNTSKKEIVVYTAKTLYPEYPAVFDKATWEIGNNWCHSRRPDCEDCYMHGYCPTAL